METGFSFPKKERLKGRDNIREVFNRKKAVSCSGAKLLIHRNGLGHNRIAFTFSRKYGNAVERNHSRRLSREVYRLLRNELRQGYDLVLLIYPEGNFGPGRTSGSQPRRKKPGGDVFSVRMEQLKELFSKAGLLDSTSGFRNNQ